jgi:hypothetical protein
MFAAVGNRVASGHAVLTVGAMSASGTWCGGFLENA